VVSGYAFKLAKSMEELKAKLAALGITEWKPDVGND
jgi:hypothetical protein